MKQSEIKLHRATGKQSNMADKATPRKPLERVSRSPLGSLILSGSGLSSLFGGLSQKCICPITAFVSQFDI